MPAAIPAAIAAEHLKDFGFLLKDVSRLYSRNFERQSAALGLSLAQCRVLARMRNNLGALVPGGGGTQAKTSSTSTPMAATC